MKWNNLFSLTMLIIFFGCASSRDKQDTEARQTSAREKKYNEALDLVQRMARLSDQRRWYDLEQVFASRTVLNYGTPELLTPIQVVDRWKPVLSYFDKTNHEITNFQYSESQGRMFGRANFSAYHQKKSDVTLRGQYEYEFFSDPAGPLKIMRLTMIPGSAIGNEDLLKRAQNVSVTRPLSYTVESVEFGSKGYKLRGWLLKPKNPYSRDVVVLGGTWTSVKEQMAYPYAQRVVLEGFPVLVFDFAGFGESEGKIRNLEDPAQKASDFLAAVNYVTNREEYEHSKVNLVGICASAGYVAQEAAADPRISRIVMIAPWLQDPEIMQQALRGSPGYNNQGFEGRLEASKKASRKYYEKDVVDYVPAASFTDHQSAMYAEDANRIDYYLNRDRGNIPQWQNRFAVMSWKPWLTFNPMEVAPFIKVPTLIIHSEQAAIPQGVKKFSSLMKIIPEVKWISGTQFDFYDQPFQMAKAVKYTIDFLNKEIPVVPTRQAQEAPVTK